MQLARLSLTDEHDGVTRAWILRMRPNMGRTLRSCGERRDYEVEPLWVGIATDRETWHDPRSTRSSRKIPLLTERLTVSSSSPIWPRRPGGGRCCAPAQISPGGIVPYWLLLYEHGSTQGSTDGSQLPWAVWTHNWTSESLVVSRIQPSYFNSQS